MTTQRTERDIILVCNPQAGGRWRELAGILDSDEAMHARRIVTDEIDDIRLSLRRLGARAKLICVYGGDGTILKLLNAVDFAAREEPLVLAFVGGGTMNVSARWCGWTKEPRVNFRRVVYQYLEDRLITRDVPLLSIRQGDLTQVGFTFGAGPAVRILNEYESSQKGKVAALYWLAKTFVAAWGGRPAAIQPLTDPIDAEILIDGQKLPYPRYAFTFCNTTGQIVRWVHPFPQERQRETFHALAYAVTKQEGLLMAPLIARGKIPIDPKSLLKPISDWKRIALGYLGRGSLPTDPRYVTATAHAYELRSSEPLYTIDGDIFRSTGEPITVTLGPTVRVILGPDSPTQRPH